MLIIKVLGAGCHNCKRVEQIARQVVAGMGIEAEVVRVEDYDEILSYNILSTPGLVINEKLVAAGRIPSPAQMRAWFEAAIPEPA